jgi:hypothetical protein
MVIDTSLFANQLPQSSKLAQQHDYQFPQLGRRKAIKVFRWAHT